MFNELSIIIVNWNLLQDTIECIDSLVKSGATLNQIIVVDSASTDGSVFALRDRYFDRLNILEMPENRGYAAGANMGIEHALKSEQQWLLLINNDTTVDSNFLDILKAGGQAQPSYSIFAPMILYHSQPKLIWSMGDRRIDHTLLTTHPYKNRKIKEYYPATLPIDFTNGCAMLVHRRVFEKIGELDESFFMYGEEVDFCERASQSGFTAACLPEARMWHKISKSSAGDRAGRRYLKVRNQIRIYRRYASPGGKWLYFVYTSARSLVMCGGDLLKGKVDTLRSTVQGWSDGWYSSDR